VNLRTGVHSPSVERDEVQRVRILETPVAVIPVKPGVARVPIVDSMSIFLMNIFCKSLARRLHTLDVP